MAAAAGVGEVERAGREVLPPFALRPVALVAAVVVVVLVAVSWRYGYHRDELYYLQQSAHLLAWTAILLLVLRILRTKNARLWLAVGVVVGAALLNKNTVFFLLFRLGVGMLATPQRRLLWSPWVVAGAVVAAAMWAPSLAWQADHGWAMFEMSRNLRREHSGVGVGIAFLPLQLLLVNPVTAPVALPVLPASALHTVPLQSVNYDLGERIGWPELSRTVVAAYRSLGRSDPAIVGSNYGEAGAVLHYGPPGIAGQALSGQNTDWWYGPPPDHARSAVLIGFSRELVERFWTGCSQFDRIRNATGVDNDEHGRPVWICTGQRSPWSRGWPGLRRYG